MGNVQLSRDVSNINRGTRGGGKGEYNGVGVTEC